MVQLTFQRATLLFSNFVKWTIANASKRKCGCKLIDALPMTTKTHIFENTLMWTGLYFSKTTTLQVHHGFLYIATATT